MPEVWAAAIGAAAAVAGTAYSVVQSNNAINAANNVKLPKFQSINAAEVNKLAVAADAAAYAASDADFRNRFPQLAAGKEASIKSAQKNLAGKGDKQVTDAVASSGLTPGGGAFGGGGAGSSWSEFQQSKDLGNSNILAKEQRDRTYFARLMEGTPARQFGLGGGDIAHISIANTGSANNFNQGLFGSRISLYNQQVQQSAQNTAAGISAIGGTINIGAGIYKDNQSSYLNSDTYRYPSTGYMTPPLPSNSSGYAFDPLSPLPQGGPPQYTIPPKG